MNDDLGRMVLNPDVNVRRCNGEMFNVYSNDKATILNAKRRKRSYRR
jgi:hypothetical protein